jgi:helicase
VSDADETAAGDVAVADLPLSGAVRDHYAAAGIESLYPPQAAAVEAGLLDGESVVAAVPTASGKTLIAELAMQAAVERGERALYVVPLRALASEKYREFDALPGLDVGVATGDLDGGDALDDEDVVVATSEKVDSLVRSGAPWLDDLGCLVVDEFHLLDSPRRGPTLEMTLARLRRRNPGAQVVALSATVTNADELAAWLDAELVASEWRPTELRRGVYYDGQIAFEEAPVKRIPPTAERAGAPAADADDAATRALVRDTLEGGGQCLVFVRSRRAAESLAATLAGADLPLPGGATGVAADVRERARTGMGRSLADATEGGVAFHHAGLRPAHRERVEAAFRERNLAVVCATPTLAAGVNLPARRVVVRDHRRYTGGGWEDLPALEVQQMMGRAGRPGLDPYGEAVIVAADYEEARALHERYLEADPDPVTSALATREALRTQVLATVASGFAATRRELIEVFEGTFHAHGADPGRLVEVADLVLAYLRSEGFLDPDAVGLRATELGAQVSTLYVDPETAVGFRDALHALERRPAERVTRVPVLEAVCASPDLDALPLRNPDRAAATTFARSHSGELLRDPADPEAFADGEFEAWLAVVKTVLVLRAHLDGVDEDAVTEEYAIGPGDLRATVERATWLASAFEAVAGLLDAAALETIREVRAALVDRAPAEADAPAAGESPD